MRAALGGEIEACVQRLAEAPLGGEIEARVQRLAEAPHAGFSVDDDGTVRWEGGALARLVAGPTLLEPGVKLLRNDLLGPAATMRVQRRLQAFARDFVALLLAPLRPDARLSREARGLLFELEAGLGVAPGRPPPGERDVFARIGVRFGVYHCFSLPMIEREREKRILVAASGARDERLSGYARVGGVLVRVDHLERVATEARRGRLAGDLLAPDDLQRVLGALGLATRVRRTAAR